jgi:hypothetical protein
MSKATTSSQKKSSQKNTRQRLQSAADNRVERTLRKATPRILKFNAVSLVACAVLGLTYSYAAVVAVFFGIVELVRLLHPHWYPFIFDKRFLYILRFAASFAIVVGTLGIVLNWQSIYNFLKPVLG